MARTQYRLNLLRPESLYELQLRAKVNGVTGAWSAVFQVPTGFDTVAPGPVQNLELAYVDGSLILTWEAPTTDAEGAALTDLRNYVVNIEDLSTGIVKGVKVTEERFTLDERTNAFLFGKLTGRLRFSVLAQDRAGNLSTSVEATFEATPPGPFELLSASSANLSVIIRWEESADVDLVYYEVYRDGELAGRTVGTELEFTDGSPGPDEHEYYVIAYDAFGLSTRSTNTLLGRAFGYWQGDLSVPGPVLNLTAATSTTSTDGGTAEAVLQWMRPLGNLDGTPYEDFNQFVVEHGRSSNGPWVRAEVSDDGGGAQSYTITGLEAGAMYYVRVAAIDRYSNRGPYVQANFNAAQDTATPSRPAAPIAAGGALTLQVSHLLQAAAGGALDADVRKLEVHVGNSVDFLVSASSYVGDLAISSPELESSVVGSFTVPDEQHSFVRVVAVDASGNRSQPSEMANAEDLTLILNQHIQDATITNAKIGNLDANKLTTGSAIANQLYIRNLLEIDDEAGAIQSSNYQRQLAGFRIGREGVEINSGVVAARTLTINNSPNLFPWEYATFGNPAAWYTGGVDSGGVTVPSHMSVTRATLSFDADAWVGEKSLRILADSDVTTAASGEAIVNFFDGTPNFDVQAGERYLISFYAKATNTVGARFRTRYSGGAIAAGSMENISIEPGAWRRYYGVWTVPEGVTGAWLQLRIGTASADVRIDGLQSELVTSAVDDALLTPAAWKSPAQTTIDGGLIRTGELVSTNFSSTSGWRIGMEGNATFLNAFLRGAVEATDGYLQNMQVRSTLTVGSSAASNSGLIRSFNGKWSLNSNGRLTATDAVISGEVDASSGRFQNVNTISMDVGVGELGFIRSNTYNGPDPSASITENSSGSVSGFSKGWLIKSDNTGGFQALFKDAFFSGTISATEIYGSEIIGGTLRGETTVSAGSYLRAGTGTTRTEIHPAVIRFYAAGSTSYGTVRPFRDDGSGGVRGATGIAASAIWTNNLHFQQNLNPAYFDGQVLILGELQAGPISSSSLTLGTLQLSPPGKTGDIIGVDDIVGSGTTADISGFRSIRTAENYTSSVGGVDFRNSDITRVDDIFGFGSTADISGFREISAGTLTETSSLEYKDQVTPATGILDSIADIDVISFQFKSDPESRQRYGVSYESVPAEARHVSKHGLKVVQLGSLASMAVGGLQELHSEFLRLSARLEALESA